MVLESFDVGVEYRARLASVLDALGDDGRSEPDPELSADENYIRGNLAARYLGIKVFGALSGSFLSAAEVLKSASSEIVDPQERASYDCAQLILLKITLLIHEAIGELTGVTAMIRERAIDRLLSVDSVESSDYDKSRNNQ